MATSQDIFDAINYYVEHLNMDIPSIADSAISTLDKVIALCQEHKEFILNQYSEDDEGEDED